jgi:hypothetical protein
MGSLGAALLLDPKKSKRIGGHIPLYRLASDRGIAADMWEADMKLCTLCGEPAGHFYIGGVGTVCYSCFTSYEHKEPQLGHAKKDQIDRPEQRLSSWGI